MFVRSTRSVLPLPRCSWCLERTQAETNTPTQAGDRGESRHEEEDEWMTLTLEKAVWYQTKMYVNANDLKRTRILALGWRGYDQERGRQFFLSHCHKDHIGSQKMECTSWSCCHHAPHNLFTTSLMSLWLLRWSLGGQECPDGSFLVFQWTQRVIWNNFYIEVSSQKWLNPPQAISRLYRSWCLLSWSRRGQECPDGSFWGS